jgi:hypothetical protein
VEQNHSVNLGLAVCINPGEEDMKTSKKMESFCFAVHVKAVLCPILEI